MHDAAEMLPALIAVPRQLSEIAARVRAPVLSALKALGESRQYENAFIRFVQLTATAFVACALANCLLHMYGNRAAAAKQQSGPSTVVDTKRRKLKAKSQ